MSDPMIYVKAIAVLIAALVLGNWFLSEVRKSRASGKPWYTPYLSVPGIVLILLLVLLPILAGILKR